jgi:hypothetical protein
MPAKKEKTEFGQQIKLLGLLVTLEQIFNFRQNGKKAKTQDSTTVTTEIIPKKFDRMMGELEECSKTPMSKLRLLQKVIGKLIFWARDRGELSRQFTSATMAPLFRLKFQESHGHSRRVKQLDVVADVTSVQEILIRRSLLILKKYITSNPKATTSPGEWAATPAILYTDAAYEPTAEFDCSMGGILALWENDKWVTYAWARDFRLKDFESEFQGVSSVIAYLETIAVEHSINKWEQKLRRKLIFIHTDNSVTFYALVKGKARNPRIHLSAGALLLKIASLNSQVWVEWVASAYNPADICTRMPTDPDELNNLIILLHQYIFLIQIDLDEDVSFIKPTITSAMDTLVWGCDTIQTIDLVHRGSQRFNSLDTINPVDILTSVDSNVIGLSSSHSQFTNPENNGNSDINILRFVATPHFLEIYDYAQENVSATVSTRVADTGPANANPNSSSIFATPADNTANDFPENPKSQREILTEKTILNDTQPRKSRDNKRSLPPSDSEFTDETPTAITDLYAACSRRDDHFF